MLFWMAHAVRRRREQGPVDRGVGAVVEGFDGVGDLVALDGVALGPLFPGVEDVEVALGVAEPFRVEVPAVQQVVRAEGVAGRGEVSLHLGLVPGRRDGLFVGVGEFLFGDTEVVFGAGEVGTSGAAMK